MEVILWFSLFIPSYILWSTPQDLTKWINVLRYISVISFISIGYVVVKLEKFKFHALIQHPCFFFFFLLLFPQTLFDPPKVLTRGSPIRQTHCLKISSKLWNLAQMQHTKSLQFWFFSGPNLLQENQIYC